MKQFNILYISILILLINIFVFSSCGPREEVRKPNIILIMADDLGYHELGCYGQEIMQTPHIDQLAAEGIRFTQFYCGSPVCAPSRCVLMTGLHTGHAYVRDNYELGGYTDETEGGQLPLPPGTNTIGRFLKEQGYVTGVIGKWGLGGPGSEGVPTKQGFDYFYGYLCQKQAHNYYPSHLWENESWDTLDNAFFMAHQRLEGDPLDPESYSGYTANEYAPDLMMGKARNFIMEHKDTTFFLYLPVTVPHLSLQVPEEEPSLAEYKAIIPDTPYVGNRMYLPNLNPRATYAAMITRMDREIGSIITLIEELGLDQNTLVLFTSDNGPTYGGVGGSDTRYFKSNFPFSGLKGDVFEGGIRIPLIAWWPGHIDSGGVTDHMAAFQDLFPTLAQAAAAPGYPNTDGISFLPLLLNQPQQQHAYLYWEFPSYGGQVAVRLGHWKAVRRGLFNNPDAPIELYDLEVDTAEENDVAALFPDVVEQVSQIILTARIPSKEFPFPALDSLQVVHGYADSTMLGVQE